jgi:hypothetical protein
VETRIIYLLDTNIWLERLLGQTHSDDVGHLLEIVTTDRLLMSDFTLHSLGIILDRFGYRSVFTQLVQDVLIDGGVALMGLPAAAMYRVVAVMDQYRLDFDDAYQ